MALRNFWKSFVSPSFSLEKTAIGTEQYYSFCHYATTEAGTFSKKLILARGPKYFFFWGRIFAQLAVVSNTACLYTVVVPRKLFYGYTAENSHHLKLE